MNLLTNFKKGALIGASMFILLLCVSGCSSDYIERQKFKVKTIDGKTLTFACPVLNLERSSLSYIYDGDCVLTNVEDET